MTTERVTFRVLLLFGDQAEIVAADVPPSERAEPERYPAADIAATVGVPVSDLPDMRLTAGCPAGSWSDGPSTEVAVSVTEELRSLHITYERPDEADAGVFGPAPTRRHPPPPLNGTARPRSYRPAAA
jgi:hypothetical protein